MTASAALAVQERVLGEMLGSVAADLEALPRAVLAEMRPYLQRAERELQQELLAWMAEGGEERFTAQQLRAALVRTRHALGTVDRSGRVLETGLQVVGAAAMELATETLEKQAAVLSSVFRGSLQPSTLDTAAIYARKRGPLFTRYARSAGRYAGRVSQQLRGELMIARIRGLSMHATAARLAQRLPALWRGAFYKAERIARTETANSYNVVHREALRDWAKREPGVLMRWDSTTDRRRCLECRRMDGEISKPNGDFGGVGIPPMHPN